MANLSSLVFSCLSDDRPDRRTRTLGWRDAAYRLGMVSDRSYATTIATWVFVIGYASRPLLGSVLPPMVMPGVYVVVVIAALVAYRRVLADAARRAWQHKTRSFTIVVGGYLGILALTVAVGYLTQYLFDYFGVAPAEPQNTGELSQPRASLVQLILPMVYIGIVAPIVEELFFRQFLIGSLGKHAPTWMSLVVSSVLFGMFHIYSLVASEWINAISFTATGLGLGLVYVLSGRNVVLSSLLHIANNLPIVIMTLLV